VSGQQRKNVPETASCFKNADRFRIKLVVEITIRLTQGDPT